MRLIGGDCRFETLSTPAEYVDGPMEELGPGVDLVSVDARAVPSDVIQRVDGVAFAIKIPKAVYDPSAERLIDVDHTALRFKLVLR